MFGLFNVKVHQEQLPLYIFPEADNEITKKRISQVKEICFDTRRFILNEDVLELNKIIAQKYEFNIFFKSLFVLHGSETGKIIIPLKFKDFYEAYYDRELIKISEIEKSKLDSYKIAKLLLTIS